MEQGQGYGHSYMPQPPPLAVPVGGVGAPVSGMAQYPPPAQFPYHIPIHRVYRGHQLSLRPRSPLKAQGV
jgi:hypothetical protein